MKGAVYVLLSFIFIQIQNAKTASNATASNGKQAKYPRFERSCYRDMPAVELNECLKINFQQNLPRFKSGIPGVIDSSIDPLFWPKFSEYFGATFITASLIIRDIDIFGFSTLKIKDIRTDVKNPQKLLINMDWSVPKIDLAGKFQLKGSIGGVKFQGAGPFKINATGVYDTWKITGSRKVGDPYMKIEGVRGRPKVGNVKVWATGAAQNERLSDLVLSTINRFWKPLYQIATPTIEREWSAFCTEKLNRVFKTVPYDELFPPQKLKIA